MGSICPGAYDSASRGADIVQNPTLLFARQFWFGLNRRQTYGRVSMACQDDLLPLFRATNEIGQLGLGMTD